ncbi:MAG: acetyltransferase [Verrucomicrobia bacterium CG_4_10_14_3_um_filter_43_23]|nr:MAG: acetyltransferase [Verrucomicrobia bacterium CG1_02_43_26]PIP58640.1 MAG: acetyltransferase [Verrucomicrobia bacterium CG22_combo_CG10-13_8_21_14_all_43_17]PIX58396.1 MAG: acetyltransferase [Verrucomicrobia bacterium CG_4_10_14_3_um_filter_43_23]PIY61234.1 MAG: acetyltransferase [Verrucomicrobia bacterium CG_4_10_14_0_8_um_filter_43_34]PJA44951.1 MAG: acetyltransferase [Verrucomicrobia bacterium CG_4_9_14_3_um_filter_43_20]
MSEIKITLSLVTELIAEQFPQWAHLPIRPVASGGIDNITFRLGEGMLIRIPSAEGYVAQVQKEQKWLPVLAPHLSLHIPEPLAMGQPSKHYPWNWSIYRWIEGASANMLCVDNLHLERLALDLAQFLNELHTIDLTDGPSPGAHNYYRGAHPSVYDTETRSAIKELQGIIDSCAATAVWEKAINSTWDKKPVWIQGDFSSGNILIKEGRLIAVIDFGCMGVGDPACDLVIAWTLLKGASRQIFKSHVQLDSDTWTRARGWALWKALITLVSLKGKADPEATRQKQIIHDIVAEDTVGKHC